MALFVVRGRRWSATLRDGLPGLRVRLIRRWVLAGWWRPSVGGRLRIAMALRVVLPLRILARLLRRIDQSVVGLATDIGAVIADEPPPAPPGTNVP